VRSLVHQRRIRSIGPEVPFTLTEWQNGNLTLADPATGRSVEVSSFGPDNRAVYQNLLPAKGGAR
jgi:putative photosynthetic complex assembly protein